MYPGLWIHHGRWLVLSHPSGRYYRYLLCVMQFSGPCNNIFVPPPQRKINVVMLIGINSSNNSYNETFATLSRPREWNSIQPENNFRHFKKELGKQLCSGGDNRTPGKLSRVWNRSTEATRLKWNTNQYFGDELELCLFHSFPEKNTSTTHTTIWIIVLSEIKIISFPSSDEIDVALDVEGRLKCSLTKTYWISGVRRGKNYVGAITGWYSTSYIGISVISVNITNYEMSVAARVSLWRKSTEVKVSTVQRSDGNSCPNMRLCNTLNDLSGTCNSCIAVTPSAANIGLGKKKCRILSIDGET